MAEQDEHIIENDDEAIIDDELEMDAIVDEMAATPPLSTKPEDEGDQDAEPEGDPKSEKLEPDDKSDKGDPQFVPLRKHHRVSEENKILRHRLDEMQGIINQSQRQQAQQPQQEAQPTNQETPPEDPMERLEWLTERYNQSQKPPEQSQVDPQRQQAEANQQEYSQYTQYAVNDLAQATQRDPAFQDLDKKLISFKVNELKMVHNLDDRSAYEQAHRALVGEIANGYSRGVPPHLVMQALAESRGIWSQPQQEAQPIQQDNADVARATRRNQHTSLSSMGGKAGRGSITAKDLAKMSEDEFSALSDDITERLMGA